MSPCIRLANLRSHFQSPWLKLPDWHSEFIYLLSKSKLQIYDIIQSNVYKKFPKIVIILIKTASKNTWSPLSTKELTRKVNKVLKWQDYMLFKLKNCSKACHFLTCFTLIWLTSLQKAREEIDKVHVGEVSNQRWYTKSYNFIHLHQLIANIFPRPWFIFPLLMYSNHTIMWVTSVFWKEKRMRALKISQVLYSLPTFLVYQD